VKPIPTLAALAAAAAAAACGAASQRPEPAPHYDPVNAPEADTRCPEERKAADAARELALGEERMGPAEAAAEAVFAEAECERTLFDGISLAQAHDQSDLKDAVDHFQGAKNLYAEVVNYQAPRWVVAGHIRTGDLFMAFRDKVREMTPEGENPPPDLAVMEEQLKVDATKAYRFALDAVDSWPNLRKEDDQIADWVAATCDAMVKLEPQTVARSTSCHR
jgi:hypothetical protein